MAPRMLSVRVALGTTGPAAAAQLDALVELAKSIEQTRASGLWLRPSPSEDGLDAVIALGALAASTVRLELAEAPSTTARRAPSLTSKYLSSLDVVAAGRVRALFGRAGESLSELAESLEVARALFRTTAPNFSGEHFRLAGAHNVPAAFADPVPLGLVVEDDAADDLDALFELAARFCELLVVGPKVALTSVLQPAARGAQLHRAGRLVGELEIRLLVGAGSARADVHLEALEALGADGLVLDAGVDPDPTTLVGEIEALAEALGL